MRKLLCIRTDNLGDVLMTEPALRSLKKAVPGREIHLLTSQAGSNAASMISVIDRCIIHDPTWMDKNGNADPENLSELIVQLKDEHYDGAVLFNVYSQNPLPAAMLCYLAGIGEVAGYCRENPYGLLSAWLPDEEPLYRIRHEVERQMDLAKHLGGTAVDPGLAISIPERDRVSGIDKLMLLTRGENFMLMHPGASETRRQYPWQLFATAAKRIHNELGYAVVLTGTDREKQLIQEIARTGKGSCLSAAGLFTVAELAAVIAKSPLLISNNSGPVHLAAAVGTSVVVLYAQTNPQHTPWEVQHRLLPFDVPEQRRSHNIIIRYAHEKAFKPAGMPGPEQILDAVRSLLKLTRSVKP